MSTLTNLTFRINEGLEFSTNERSETLFITLCIIIITICVLVHVSLLFWVFCNIWKITLQRSVAIQDKNIDNYLGSQNVSTIEMNEIERSVSDSEQLEISANHMIVIYRAQNYTTELFPSHQFKGIS